MKILALLLMSFIFVSCGGGKTTATLSISRGMVFANTSFSGGIYIAGFKADGSETFLATITSGNTTNVTISQGTWDFKVIAWDGGGVMQGTPYCKFVDDFNHATDGESLEITTTNAECFMTNISGTSQHQTASSFKSLAMNTCGAMYNSSNSSMLTVSGYFDPCTQSNYPLEYRHTYGYYKLHLFNQTSAGSRTPVSASSCLTAQSNAPVVFPSRLPVTVKFYKDSGCTQEVDEFIFKHGLDFGMPQNSNRATNDFDWQVTADSAYYFVTIAHGASKRGTSAFHTETPLFKCMDGGMLVPCTKYPPISANTYYVDPDAYAVIRIPVNTCVTPSFGGGITATFYSCDNVNGAAYVAFKVHNTSPINGSLSFNGTAYTLKVGNANPGYSYDRIREAYKTMKRVLGHRTFDVFDNSLQDDFDEGDNPQMGLLDPAIYEISPMGAGGLFYDYYTQCSVGAIPMAARSYKKKGVTYTVTLSGIAENAPGFTARNDEPEFLGDELRYNRRIIVRKFVGPSYTTEKVIDFSCDNFSTNQVSYLSNEAQVRNGRMEEQRNYSYNGKDVVLKKLIFWNTASPDTGRFDVYRTKTITMAGTVQKIERNFYRATKALSDTYNDFKVHGMSYEAVRDGSSYDENIKVSEVDGKVVSTVVSYSHKALMDLSIENATVGTVFNNTLYASEMAKIRYGYNPISYETEQSKISSSGQNFIQARKFNSQFQVRYTDAAVITEQILAYAPDNIATDISYDGTKMIAATNNGTTIHYYTVIDGSWSTGSFSATSTPYDIKVGILNDGTYVIAYLESSSNMLRWHVSGSDFSSPYTSDNHKTLEITKDSSMFYMLVNRTNAANTMQYLDICKLNDSQSCGFNALVSKVSSSPITYGSMYHMGGNIHLTYKHDGALASIASPTSTLLTNTVVNAPYTYRYTPYAQTAYTNLDVNSPLRSGPGTTVEVQYPYFNPTVLNFEMMPAYLNGGSMNSYFDPSFSTVTN